MEKAKTKPNWVRGSCIGRGSFGTVSRAVDKSDGGVFAVKSVGLGPGSEARAEALENEIRILRRLSSPWVVAYLGDDMTVEDGAVEPFRNLHLEYLPGGTAADLAADADDEGIVRSLTWCVASALSYVHSLGIVHCDVKGRNVLLGPARYAAKLSDFGTAAESAAAPRGSPLWMAPEVIRGEYQGPESDVWSLGCTVIEMVTGKPGWEDRGADTLCRIGYSDELPELPTRLSELGLDFLDKCLRRDRTERWSCDQLLRHPFISSSAVPIMDSHQSPRCVLDLLDTEFCEFDDDDDDEEDDKFPELPTQSVRDRIGKLASTTGVNWESDGWIEVRNVISEKAPEVSEARCCRGGDEEGTSSEFSIFSRTEGEMEGTSGEYSDWKEIERTNLEYFDFGGGIEEAVVVDGGRRWRGSEAGTSCRCKLGGWNWVADGGHVAVTAGGILFVLYPPTSLYSTPVMCKDLVMFYLLLLSAVLFTFYLIYQFDGPFELLPTALHRVSPSLLVFFKWQWYVARICLHIFEQPADEGSGVL
ncbi:mitogen-activated protein kinase kinase kinase 18-like [Rhododendron vialii]|uniref:mitogen-activated protein kinase kinase kinase 18-like n=1 Tax=Rhododendron vialii TaxID=182163 RepID=UPI00265F3ABF|nr:mitogen-activated protein kinase kinase kinase 18-like [Rhododendron vialii]